MYSALFGLVVFLLLQVIASNNPPYALLLQAIGFVIGLATVRFGFWLRS